MGNGGHVHWTAVGGRGQQDLTICKEALINNKNVETSDGLDHVFDMTGLCTNRSLWDAPFALHHTKDHFCSNPQLRSTEIEVVIPCFQRLNSHVMCTGTAHVFSGFVHRLHHQCSKCQALGKFSMRECGLAMLDGTPISCDARRGKKENTKRQW